MRATTQGTDEYDGVTKDSVVTVTAEACTGYSKTTKDVEVAISPIPLTIVSATAVKRTYENGNTSVDISGVAFKNNAGQSSCIR